MNANKFIENIDFEYSGKDAILEIMDKIREFVNEDKWLKRAKLVIEFEQLKQKEERQISNSS